MRPIADDAPDVCRSVCHTAQKRIDVRFGVKNFGGARGRLCEMGVLVPLWRVKVTK